MELLELPFYRPAFFAPVSVPVTSISSSHIAEIKTIVLTNVAKIGARLFHTRRQGLFTLPNPYSWVVVLLVGLIRSFWISHLRLEVLLFAEYKVLNTQLTWAEIC